MRSHNGYYRNTKKKREYYQQLYSNKFDDLEEMDIFLENYSMKTESRRNRSTEHDIEYVIKTLTTNKSP